VIVDSSAIVAIIVREAEWEALVDLIASGASCGVGAPTLAETGIVLAAKMGPTARGLLARFLQESAMTTVPFADAHWPVAIDAYARFGKGRHAANLNFGDCMTYAVARLADQPLLFVGDDFRKTDLVPARTK
jgi:ribonuclease VapC